MIEENVQALRDKIRAVGDTLALLDKRAGLVPGIKKEVGELTEAQLSKLLTEVEAVKVQFEAKCAELKQVVEATEVIAPQK